MDKGAHFYRCDFQVHTPRDIQWNGRTYMTVFIRSVSMVCGTPPKYSNAWIRQRLPPADRLAKYRFEVRKVSRDGFVSYDGVRYGVPWPHSGREVTVRDVGGFIEIYREQQLIARHKKQAQSRTLAMCERQYANLSTTQGNVYPKPLGIRIPVQDVEVRSLEVYERLMEVGT